MQPLHGEFTQRIIDIHGEAGRRWVDRLPDTLHMVAEKWGLQIQPPFQALSYHYVALAQRANGDATVLKLGVPSPDLTREARALEIYAGHGAVRLLESDLELGAFLLERLSPGTPLSTIQDERQATSAAAAVIRQLRRPVPKDHPFPTVQDWGKGFQRLRARFEGGYGPFPRAMVDAAETLFDELCASMGPPVVLHGDLHHDNILSAERQAWLAIDPQGVVGEAEYEVGAFLRNPMPEMVGWSNLASVLADRLDQLAEELGYDRDRLLKWSFAQAVLSCWWGFEDHGNVGKEWIEVARVLFDLVRRVD